MPVAQYTASATARLPQEKYLQQCRQHTPCVMSLAARPAWCSEQKKVLAAAAGMVGGQRLYDFLIKGVVASVPQTGWELQCRNVQISCHLGPPKSSLLDS
jgi:hypothetical protein